MHTDPVSGYMVPRGRTHRCSKSRTSAAISESPSQCRTVIPCSAASTAVNHVEVGSVDSKGGHGSPDLVGIERLERSGRQRKKPVTFTEVPRNRRPLLGGNPPPGGDGNPGPSTLAAPD